MLDQAILEFIKDQRKERITLTDKKFRRKDALLFKELYPDVQLEFRASRGWLRRTSRRNNLAYRRVTRVGQKVPKNAVEIAEQFLEDMKNIGEFANLGNMDETPSYFDIPISSTIDKKGVQTDRCGASSFHCSFNSRSKKNRKWIHPLLTSSIIDI